jgi:hypothetical protein
LQEAPYVVGSRIDIKYEAGNPEGAYLNNQPRLALAAGAITFLSAGIALLLQTVRQVLAFRHSTSASHASR